MAPDSWRTVKLKDVSEYVTVGHVGPMMDEYREEGVPFLRSQNIQPFHLELSEVKYIGPEFHRKLKKSELRPGDVAIVRTGYPGTASVIPEKLPNANCADLVIVRPSDELDGRFLAAVFNSAWGKGRVSGSLVGVAQQHFNVGVAKEMEIHLPPRSAQEWIGDVLGRYGDLIENNMRRIDILEETAQAIYREWFVNFRSPGYDDVEMVESDLGLIPEGWKVRQLSDVARVNRQNIQKGDEPERIGYINISSVSPGRVNVVDRMLWSEAPSRARRVVQHGDVLWSTVRPNLRAFALVLDPAPNTVASTGFAVLSAEAVPFTYLYCYTATDWFSAYLVNHTRGSAYPAVNVSDFKAASIVVPPDEVLGRFHEITEPIFLLRDRIMRQSEILRKIRDLLLPKLVSGEISVGDVESTLEEAVG